MKTELLMMTNKGRAAQSKNWPWFTALFYSCILLFAFCLHASAQGTAFTYQGRLSDSGAPANGTYDLRFTIYDSTNLPGVVIAGPLTNSATTVSNGLFMVALDFGAGVFTGPDRWLEIGVRTNGAGAFSTLPARQLVTPTPYAINAANLGGALHVDANNTNGAPNIIGGSQINQVDPGVVGAVIAGGGTTNYFGNVYSNRVAGNFSSVGGGFGNLNQSYGSVISGGVLNQLQTGGSYSGIGSGLQNLIEAGTDQSFIGGGYGNSIRSFARSSVISGGQLNTNGAPYGVIAGGQHNVIEWSADSATISGGANNWIRSNSPISVITGGHDNTIQSAAFAFIGAGGYHQVLSNATDSSIVSGAFNTIQPGASESFIGNGGGNTIGTNSSYSSIVGGQNNSIQSSSSYAVIGGGFNNAIQSNANNSVIAGGHDSVIQNASFAFIGAGGLHQILSNATDAAIVAGGYHTIQPGASGSFIGGGYYHTIGSNSSSSAIVGGFNNTIQTNSSYSTIGGGYQNTIQFNDLYSTIAGGGGNTIQTNAAYSTISGGVNQQIQSNAFASAIGGGNFNSIQTNAIFGTIPGGYLNMVAGQYGFAAGQQAEALHNGSFVWADTQFAPFPSTTNDQFNVRAQGGARFVTGGAGMTVDGNPVLTSGSGISITQNTNGAPNVIEGASINFVPSYVVGATISGGGVIKYVGVNNSSNSVTDNFGTVGGGDGNSAGFAATIGGGEDNSAFTGSTVAGGFSNHANGNVASIGGGQFNLVSLEGGTIGGGEANTNFGLLATIGGGEVNTASAPWSTVSGGEFNTASGTLSTISGGVANIASGRGGTVSGGISNQVTGSYATIAGGATNLASGQFSFAAGLQAQALHDGSFVWADSQNVIFASTAANQFNVRAKGGVRLSTSGGGMTLDGPLFLTGQFVLNHSNGFAMSSVGNFTIDAPFFAGGRFTVLTNGNVGIGTATPVVPFDVRGAAHVLGSNNWDVTGTEGDFRIGNDSTRFKIGVATNGGGAGDVWMRAHGGTGRIFVKTPGGTTIYSNEGQTAGVSLAANGTSWAVVSDRNAKKDFAPIDSRQILDKLAAIPITQWHYKWEEESMTPHIGPMAQDFKAAFYPGTDDKSITTQEADGVTFAAIQGLNEKVETGSQKAEARIQRLEAENTELKQRLEKLERLIEAKVASAN